MDERNRTKKAQVIDFRRDGDFFYQKGMTSFRKGDFERARHYLDRAIQFNPNAVDYLCRQAEILSELENYELSNRLLKKVVYELDSNVTDCYFFIANNYAYLGEIQEALDEIQIYLTVEPNGTFKREAEDLYQMLSSELKELEGDERPYVTEHERGRLALEHGHFDEAIHHFKQVIEDEPDFLAAQNNLSIAYFSMGDPVHAFDAVQRVLQKDPGNIHALCNLTTFFDQLGQQKDRAAVVAVLGQMCPIYPEHCGKLGSTYLLIGDYQKAYQWLNVAEKRGVHRDQVFYYWVALAAYRCGHLESARKHWRRADYFSDKPFHPFKYNKIQDMMFEADASGNFMVKDLVRKALKGEEEAYRLVALFYAAAHYMHDVLSETAQRAQSAEIKRMATRIISETRSGVRDANMQIMREVEQLAGGQKEAMKHPELYSFWAVIDAMTTASENDVKGWAAALIYLWNKECGEAVTQKKIAEEAGTTVYRLRKKIHELSCALRKKWDTTPHEQGDNKI
ncbi:tetratricopeptide repeat protein [Sporolactobacillus terrae]|uniref:Tetratricopeptide repeat protein n=1 Tax=Sporolactobacillus terrae TaxID=269673 RepID=A0ABX5Q5R3_9BACL|nr:tetratricopeptide repeat protein [Sporolactobacillus terrae]QAA21986.1 hypothetical protein C0674_04770 [Sporolactobacillus terrae]QAA24959.1 hypothetical protein C0679_04745 [Sporolactobacillus terrae]UAK16782.1 tetratricopeptide repeat protein [Sporolactobacillus terrae]